MGCGTYRPRTDFLADILSATGCRPLDSGRVSRDDRSGGQLDAAERPVRDIHRDRGAILRVRIARWCAPVAPVVLSQWYDPRFRRGSQRSTLSR